MNKKTHVMLLIVLIVSVLAFSACSGSKEAEAPVQAASAPAVSDGSEDLVIDYRLNVAGTDEENYFHWKGNVRYMAAEDHYDAVSAASALGSTHLFMMYLYDVEAKETMSSGLRGLFLYGVNGAAAVAGDNLPGIKGRRTEQSLFSMFTGEQPSALPPIKPAYCRFPTERWKAERSELRRKSKLHSHPTEQPPV